MRVSKKLEKYLKINGETKDEYIEKTALDLLVASQKSGCQETFNVIASILAESRKISVGKL